MLTRSGADIVIDRRAGVVEKLHRPGIDPRALATRLRIAAGSGSLLHPLGVDPEPVGDRWRTRWPLVDVVTPEPGCAPWGPAGRLLARLHREALPSRPPHGWPQRMRRAAGQATGVVREAAAALPDVVWRAGSASRPRTMTHGDFHLGQLGRGAIQPWVLIDIDDLGSGDPVWDLARPAGFWAAGLIPDADWSTFLTAYRDADGPALPPDDEWPVLDPFARAAVVHATASGVAHGDDDETQHALLAACARMV